MKMTPEKIAECKRATAAARKVLKKGDRICAVGCMGIKYWFTFSHFEGDWICSTGDISDCHARHIYKLNGQPVKFA